MSELLINRPIIIDMSLIEIDEVLPSFKVKLCIDIVYPTTKIQYTNDVWFSRANWDDFAQQLRRVETMSKQIATLHDLSHYTVLNISAKDYQFFFELMCRKPDIGNGAFNLVYSIDIDEEVLSHIRARFNNFPKWWI